MRHTHASHQNRQFDMTGSFWRAVATLNENFGSLGFLIIGLFVFSWLGSAIFYRLKGFDELETSSGG